MNRAKPNSLNKSAAALLAAIQLETIGTKPPKGFYTSSDIAELSGRSLSTVRSSLRKGVKSGNVVMRKFRIEGAREAVPHYRIKG